jgi:4-hydroxybenzoate polyprenyltransferase
MGADSPHPDPFDDSGSDGSRHRPLPSRVTTVTTVGVYALVAGVLLVGASFLTDPVPDPSFPWATLPESLRIAYTQPRIEHWPVTYTIGLWLVVFTLPLVLLYAYHRYGPDSRFGRVRGSLPRL